MNVPNSHRKLFYQNPTCHKCEKRLTEPKASVKYQCSRVLFSLSIHAATSVSGKRDANPAFEVFVRENCFYVHFL